MWCNSTPVPMATPPPSQHTSAQRSVVIQCGKKGKKRTFTELSEDESELTEDESDSEVEAEPPAKRFRAAFNPLSAQPRKNDLR